MPSETGSEGGGAVESPDYNATPRFLARLFFGLVCALGFAIVAARWYANPGVRYTFICLAVLVGISLFISGLRRLGQAGDEPVEVGFKTWAVTTVVIVALAIGLGQAWMPEDAESGTVRITPSASPTDGSISTDSQSADGEWYLAKLDYLIDTADSATRRLSRQLQAWDDPEAMADAIDDLLALPHTVTQAAIPPGWRDVSETADSGLASLKSGASSIVTGAAGSSAGDDVLTVGSLVVSGEDEISAGMAALRSATSMAATLLGQGSAATSSTTPTGPSLATANGGSTVSLEEEFMTELLPDYLLSFELASDSSQNTAVENYQIFHESSQNWESRTAPSERTQKALSDWLRCMRTFEDGFRADYEGDSAGETAAIESISQLELEELAEEMAALTLDLGLSDLASE